MTQAAGIAAIETDDYYQKNCQTIMENRAYTTAALEALGFQVLPSRSNFLFAQSSRITGLALYQRLKERGVLVRHFDKPRIDNFVRITVGTRAQMDILLTNIESILQQEGLAQ
jgi:histidinol-phosphate aminotransferase